jgi:hypothetical protein
MNRKTFLALPVALCALAFGAGGASATQFVTNGGFESSMYTNSRVLFGTNTPATDWTSTGSWVLFCSGSGIGCDNSATEGYLAPPVPLSPQGGNYMAFDGDTASGFPGPFTQTIAGLTVGATYTLSFYMAGAEECCADTPTTEDLTATIGGLNFTTPTISTPADGFSLWTLYTTSFIYDGTSNVLTFLADGGPEGAPPYALLDGVSLTSTTGATPEPATWLMIVAGFAGLGLAARARRKSKAVLA